MSSQPAPSQAESQGSQSSQDKTTNSSSSSSGTSHSVSSSNHSSGMDTVPTQEMPDTLPVGSDDEPEPHAYARLMAERPPFSLVYLTQDEHSFGRDDSECDIALSSEAHKRSSYFKAYSKVHFRIKRKETSKGTFSFLHDLSSNGTFINGIPVGKGNNQCLLQFDTIALAHRRNKAYMFHDLLQEEDSSVPPELSERYFITKELGKGAYGEVRLAFVKSKAGTSGGQVAIKIIPNKKLTMRGRNESDSTSTIMKEVNILKQLNHPCIVKIIEMIESADKTYIVLELVEGGELFDRVVKVQSFPDATAKLLFYQMLLAVQYLHNKGVTHRDLKPENVLLSSAEEDDCLIKITDFGVSKIIDASTMMKTMCGTPNYLAPEILKSNGMGEYDSQVDCWSLGVILFICLGGYPPFSDERGDMPLPKQILTGSVKFAKEFWSDASKHAIDLVKKLLTVDPKQRLTIAEALNHPWLQDEEMQKKAKSLMHPHHTIDTSIVSGVSGEFVVPQNPQETALQATKKRGREQLGGGDAPVQKAAHLSPTKDAAQEKVTSPEKSPEKPTSPKKNSPQKPTSPRKPTSPQKKK